MSDPIITVPPIAYTARDYLSIMEALKTNLQTKFPTTWRDFYESGMGQAILGVLAYTFDNLSFANDVQANETYLDTAQSRNSVLLLGKLMGYKLRTPTSASVACVATLQTAQTEAVVVAAGTTIRSLTGVDFLTTEEFRIEAGNTTGTITFVAGVNRQDMFVSDGTSFQKFKTSKAGGIRGTFVVKVAGDEWTEVESLVYAGADDQAFAIEWDNDDYGYITFGDGTVGKVPPTSSSIEVTYRNGGGINGNLNLNEINGTVQGQRESVYPAAYVSVKVQNSTERGSGGEERESTTHAKLWIPRWARTNGRAVTESDYDALANAFSDPTYGAPAFVKARLKQEIPELNTVVLSIWGLDSYGNVTTPSTGLKNALLAYFNNDGAGAVRMICTHCEVEDGIIVYVDTAVQIKVQTDYVRADAISAVQSNIDSLFATDNLEPGQDFRMSLLYNAVQQTPGVQYCLVKNISASLEKTDLLAVATGASPTFTPTISLESGLYIIPKSCEFYYGARVETLTDDGEGNILNGSNTVVGSIDYATGVTSFTFAATPTVGTLVYGQYRHVLDYQRGEAIGTGDSTTKRFKGTLTYPPVNPYDPAAFQKGIVFSDGVQTVIDDGSGNLVGNVDGAGVNRIDYDTGSYDFTFAAPPTSGTDIMTTYRQILSVDSDDLPIDKDQIAVKGLVNITTL